MKRKHMLEFIVSVGIALTFLSYFVTFYHNQSQHIPNYVISSVDKKAIAETVGNKAEPLQRSRSLTVIPKVIYMFWDEGWDEADTLQKLCLESFRDQNKDFVIKLLSLTSAEALIERRKYYSDEAWNFARVEAKSDIIRIEVLARFGGVWADASVYCNEPLSNWLTDELLRVKFFAYERRDAGVINRTSPFIATWFLAASQDSMIRTWRDVIRHAWSRSPWPPWQLGYYWAHQCFRFLVRSNSTFRALFKEMPFYDAGGPHCIIEKVPRPHVYKLTSGLCWPIREQVLDGEYEPNSTLD